MLPGTLLGLTIDLDCDLAVGFLERPGGEHHPGILLGAGVAALVETRADKADQFRYELGCRIAFGYKSQNPCAITQAGAVIGAVLQQSCGRLDPLERRPEALRCARLVAIKRERRADLRLRHRGREAHQLGVGVIAQIADRCFPAARHDIERIGYSGTLILNVGRVGELVLEIVERQLCRFLRHRKAFFPGAGDEVGDIGIEPEITGPWTPEPEAAGGRLVRDEPVDCSFDALPYFGAVETVRRIQFAQIEKRKRPAGGLFGTSIGVEVERHQERGDIEIGIARDPDADRSAFQQASLQQFPVDAETAAIGRQFDDAFGGDGKCCRADLDRFVPIKRQTVRADQCYLNRIGTWRKALERQGDRRTRPLAQLDFAGRIHGHLVRMARRCQFVGTCRSVSIGKFDQQT